MIAFNHGDLIIRQGRDRLTIVLADFDSSKATIYPEKYKDLRSIAAKYPATKS